MHKYVRISRIFVQTSSVKSVCSPEFNGFKTDVPCRQ